MTGGHTGGGDPRRTVELLWGVAPDRPRRGPRPRHDVADVVRVAVAIADRDGLAGLSMRRVAEELGLTAMSVYGYVPGKAELLDLMVDRVHGEFPVEAVLAGTDWRARLEVVARANRALYLRHPWLLTVATGRPTLGPNVTAKYDAELRALDGLGLGDVEMDLVVSVLADYVHGAARGAVEAARTTERTGETDQEWWDRAGPVLAEVLTSERFPLAVRVGAAAGAEHRGAYDPERSFAFGLQRLLDGVGVLLDGR